LASEFVFSLEHSATQQNSKLPSNHIQLADLLIDMAPKWSFSLKIEVQLPANLDYLKLAGATRHCPGHYIKIIKCIVRAKVAR
jgi:hypothetical protein